MVEAPFDTLFKTLVDSYDSVAEDLAAAQRKHFEALVEQGFSEEEALELIKHFEMNGNAN